MIDFYNLIDSNNENSFNEYTKGYIKQISLESFEVSEYIIESSNSGLSKIVEKVKSFFKKIGEFIKKWWNKLLKFLGLKDDDEESDVNITDKAIKKTEEHIEEISEEIEEDIDDISKKKEEIKNKLNNNKAKNVEKYKKLYEKYFTKDKDKFDEIKNNIDRYVESGLNGEPENKFNKFESKKYDGKFLRIAFYDNKNTKLKSLFKTDDERISFYKNAIFKKYDEIEFKELDILKLYGDIKTSGEYLSSMIETVNNVYDTITKNNMNTRDEISNILRKIRLLLNESELDTEEEQAISHDPEFYFTKNSSSNIIYIISYLQEISKLQIVHKSAERESNDVSKTSDIILKYFEQMRINIDTNDTPLANSFTDTLTKFSNFEKTRNKTFMKVIAHFAKLSSRIADVAIDEIDDLQDKIKNYPDLTDEEKLNILESIDSGF